MPLLQFSYIKQICVHSARAQTFEAGALEKQILFAHK